MGWGTASQEGIRDNRMKCEREVCSPALGVPCHHYGWGAEREKVGSYGEPVAQKVSIKLLPRG